MTEETEDEAEAYREMAKLLQAAAAERQRADYAHFVAASVEEIVTAIKESITKEQVLAAVAAVRRKRANLFGPWVRQCDQCISNLP